MEGGSGKEVYGLVHVEASPSSERGWGSKGSAVGSVGAITQLESSQCWKRGSTYCKFLLLFPLISDPAPFLGLIVIHPSAHTLVPHPSFTPGASLQGAEGCPSLGRTWRPGVLGTGRWFSTAGGSVASSRPCTDTGVASSGTMVSVFWTRM